MAQARIETPLKKLMEAEGRTQAWLARQLGVKRQTVWMWMNGIHEPAEPTQKRIADLLGQTVEDLWPQDEADAA